MNLILSAPSIEYAQAVSHELWMLARPVEYSQFETSQFYCVGFAHPDGTKVAIGPIDGIQRVHANADEVAFVDLIDAAITPEERQDIIDAINAAKGGSISIQEMIEGIPSLAGGLITTEQMKTDGWFDEPIVEDSIDV
jgi:hypothetical protein